MKRKEPAMPQATSRFYNRLVLVFDFDGTLAPDAIDQLLKKAGVDAATFRKEHQNKLKEEGWDSLLAGMYSLLKLSERNKEVPLTRQYFKEMARQLAFYEGVEEMFDKVRKWARAIVKDVDVEFYLLSSGLVDLYRHTGIAREFTELWGSEFHFDESGKAVFIKQVITHPEKQRYILQMAKGLGVEGANSPSDVYRPVPEEEWHVPLDQVIYVGDGLSDMPSFSLMNEYGGIGLGVVDASKTKNWDGYSAEHAGRRVQNLAKADYADNSELMQSLQLSVESICKIIALRKLSKGE